MFKKYLLVSVGVLLVNASAHVMAGAKRMFAPAAAYLLGTSLVRTEDSDDVAKLREENLQRLLKTKQCVGCDLNYTHLIFDNLRGANLKFAHLNFANMQFANLTGANLLGADLGNAHLKGAKLEGANLQVANLTAADLGGANLMGVNFQLANLEFANLKFAELKGAKNLHSAQYKKCSMFRGERLYGEGSSYEYNKAGKTDAELAILLSKGKIVCQEDDQSD